MKYINLGIYRYRFSCRIASTIFLTAYSASRIGKREGQLVAGEGGCLKTTNKKLEKTILKNYNKTVVSFPGGAGGIETACQCRKHETWVPSWVGKTPLEEEIATHSSILA